VPFFYQKSWRFAVAVAETWGSAFWAGAGLGLFGFGLFGVEYVTATVLTAVAAREGKMAVRLKGEIELVPLNRG
jgi:hypothetical protein